MHVEIVDLSNVPGVQDSLCYGIARTNQMADKKAVRNHLDCVHAIALANLAGSLHVTADQAVHERRLAHVRAPDDRDMLAS